MNISLSTLLIALVAAIPAIMVPLLLKLARYIKTHDDYLEMGIKRLNLMDESLCYLELYIQNETKKDLLLKDLCLMDEKGERISFLRSEPFLKQGGLEDGIYKNKEGNYVLLSASHSSLIAMYSFSLKTPAPSFYLSYQNEKGKRLFGKIDEGVYQKKKIRFLSKKS